MTAKRWRSLCVFTALLFIPTFVLGVATLWDVFSPIVFACFFNARTDILLKEAGSLSKDQSILFLKRKRSQLIAEMVLLLNFGLLSLAVTGLLKPFFFAPVFGLDALLFDSLCDIYKYGTASLGLKLAFLSGCLSVFTVAACGAFCRKNAHALYNRILGAESTMTTGMAMRYWNSWSSSGCIGFCFWMLAMAAYFQPYQDADVHGPLVTIICAPLLSLGALSFFMGSAKASAGFNKFAQR